PRALPQRPGGREALVVGYLQHRGQARQGAREREAKPATRRLQEIGGWQAHPRSDDHQLEAGPSPAIPRLPRADQPPPLGRDPAPYTNYLTGPAAPSQDG